MPNEFRGPRAVDVLDIGDLGPPDHGWAERRTIPFIAPSTAWRIPGRKRRGSSTGFVVDPFRRRQLYFESGLEQNALLVLVADPRVALVEEQLPPVTLHNEDGSTADHMLDIRVTWHDGTRTGISVKWDDDVERKDLVRTVGLYAAQARERSPDGRTVPVADRYTIMTERHLDALRVSNASLVVETGSDLDAEGQAMVAEWLARAGPERLTLREVARGVGLGSRGYRAAIACVQSGLIVPLPDVHLAPEAVVVNGAFAGAGR